MALTGSITGAMRARISGHSDLTLASSAASSAPSFCFFVELAADLGDDLGAQRRML